MGLSWRYTGDDRDYWYAYGAEEGDPTRSIWRVVPTDGEFDLWVESGVTKEPAHRVATYPTLEEGLHAGDAFHDSGEL